MRVTNIMPKDRIEVTLDYSQLLVPENAVYEFVYPTVVGPRYKGGVDAGQNRWMASPPLPEGQAAPYSFALKAHLETGVPIKELSSPSHHIVKTSSGPTSTDVTMDDAAGGNRDFVLRYRLSGDRIESGVLLSPPDARDQGTGTFAVMMEPPRAPKRAELPPREYLFLLDVSGSMNGFPLDTAKELMRKLLPQLRAIDSFDVALFSGAAYVLNPAGSVAATPNNVKQALESIERQQGGGGTELMGGLEMTYRIPKRDPGVSRTVVVVTDGFVGVEAQAFRFVREHLREANLFAFGIGSSVNRGLIEGLARAGLGEPFVVLNTGEAAGQAERLRKLIEEPVLTHISVTFKSLDTSEVSPTAIPDLLSRRPLIVLGQYRGAPQGTVTITGLAGGHTPFRQEIALSQGQVRAENAPLRALWARRWVTLLEDEHHLTPQAALAEGITQLGLHYHLLTPFTSFVAVDSEVANGTGALKEVTQPLPLPEGVSQSALGQVGFLKGIGTAGMEIGAAFGRGGLDLSGTGEGTMGLGNIPATMSLRPAARSKTEEKSGKKHAAAPTVKVFITEGWVAKSSQDATDVFLAAALKGERCAFSGPFSVKLLLDVQGRITRVIWLAGDKTVEGCVSRQWQGMVVPHTQGGSAFVVTVSVAK